MTSATWLLTSLAVLASVSTPRPASSQVPRTRRTVLADSCLPPSEFQLQGVALTSLASMALETLGKSLRVATDSGEDDGGRYEVQTFHYRSLEFDDVRGFVDRVATHSPQVATPSGLRPGLSLEGVRRVLRDQGVRFAAPADTILIPICVAPDTTGVAGPEGDMALVLDKTRHVRTLLMRAARP